MADPIAFNLIFGRLVFRLYRVHPRVFVIHGHDHAMRDSLLRFLSDIGVEAVVLDEQANKGLTIIEKFERYSRGVSLAVALLSPDDVGYPKNYPKDVKPKARQNVVFELGYFVGKLGRQSVIAIHDGDVEIPSDYSGVVYIKRQEDQRWKIRLIQELEESGVYLAHAYQKLLRSEDTAHQQHPSSVPSSPPQAHRPENSPTPETLYQTVDTPPLP